LQRRILSVFIASPSDLVDERDTLRKVVERLNKIYGKRIGLQIELLGWEDTLASFSRPQALINKDVENCDLFIGILWKRWGTESGKFSSGFEEEFSIARNRRTKGEKPEIWMFFKEIENELLKDPGEQLKKCIQFKRQLIDSKELLFKEFTDANSFRDTVSDDLSAYLLDINSIYQKDLTYKETESPMSKVLQVDTPKHNDIDGGKNEELLTLFTKVGNCLGAGTEDELDYWERIRVYLSTSALFSQSHTGEVFGTHASNLVYRKRNVWNFSSGEKWFLIRTFLSDSSNVIPGWFWLSKKDTSEIENVLFYLCRFDSNNVIRKGALSVLKHSDITPPIEIVRNLFENDDNDIVIATIELIMSCQEKEFLDLIEPLLSSENEKVKNMAMKAYIDLQYLFDPEKSFNFLKSKATEVTNVYEIALNNLDIKVHTDLIFSAIFEAAPRIREYAATYLCNINAMTADIAEKILVDTDSFTRKVGFVWLINHGRDFSISEVSKLFPKSKEEKPTWQMFSTPQVTEDDVVPLVLRKRTKEELEKMVGFYSILGREAYEALVTSNYSTMADRIRADLDSNFEGIKQNSVDELYSEFGDKASSLLARYTPDIEEFIKDSYIKSALKGLTLINDEIDIVWARQFLGELKHGMGDDECISIIEKHGDHTDIDHLINLAKKTYGQTQRKALKAAIGLSDNQLNVIENLANGKDRSISEMAVEHIHVLERVERIKLAEKLLFSEYEKVRLLAVNALAQDLGRNKLEDILNSYIESETYYYNVVVRLDAVLFAPGKFKP